MEKLLKEKKYLNAFNSSNASLKIDQYLPQRVFGEANSNFFIPRLCFING